MVERLSEEQLGDGVAVEDLHYGALAVAQLLEDLRPDALVLVGAQQRGRQPGAIERTTVEAPRMDRDEAHVAVSNAGTGYVDIDLVVEVAAALDALPPRTVTIEVEPASTGPSEELSPEAEAALDEVVDLIHGTLRDVTS